MVMRQFCLPSLAALSLLSISTVAATDELTQPSRVPVPAVSNMLPADVPLVVMVNTKPEAWNLSRFQLFQSASAIPQLLPFVQQLDYTEDIKSWLGDQVALALMPKIGSQKTTLDSSLLMLAPVKDKKRLQAFLDKFQFGEQQRVIKRQYKGITILKLQLKPQSWQSQIAPPVLIPNLSKPQGLQKERSLEIAFLPGYIVTAQTAKPIEQLIDTFKGSDTLAQNPQFQRTFQHFQSHQSLVTLYENPAKFLPLVESLAKDPSLPFPLLLSSSVYSEQLKAYSSLDASLLVQTEGLRWQINAYRQTPKTDIATNVLSPKVSQILAWIPAATYSLTAGGDLNQRWQTTVATFSAEPQLKDLLTQFRNFIRTSTGLDIERDITAWMDGEYVFFLYPTKGGISKLVSPNFNLGIGFLVQTSDRAAAEATLRKLEQSVNSSKGSIAVASRSIKGEPVTSWEPQGEDSSQSLFAYSWVNSNTLLMTTGLGAMADLVPQPYVSLSKSYTFNNATRSLPQPNNGYSYMNMGSFLSWFYGFLLPQYNDPSWQALKEIPGAIRSISATSSTTSEREQYDGLVVLAPAKASR